MITKFAALFVFGLAILPGSASAAGLASTSSPQNDPAAVSVWPNVTSRANSDSWLVENHDRLREMRPRLLLLNFSNEVKPQRLEQLTGDLIKALAESSRYHGYRDSAAPAFLKYQIFKFVDLRQPGVDKGNSPKIPLKPGVTNTFNVEYGGLFSADFAPLIGVADPRDSTRFLRLDELVEQGFVHEVWIFGEATPDVVAYECIEQKPLYDDKFARQGNQFVQAGNGGDPDQRWIGRSLRIGFVNTTRGIGCYMESLSHSIEGMSNSGAIPYFTRYFREFSGHDLKSRYQLPWDSFYPLWGETNGLDYPNPYTVVARFDGQSHRVEPYVAFGGNVHFTPNGRRHYDLENTAPVLSTIEDWRIGSGPAGADRRELWTNEKFAKYRHFAPDCMGPWLVYWRQNFPGLNNLQKDDQARPMKNWWPFLFY